MNTPIFYENEERSLWKKILTGFAWVLSVLGPLSGYLAMQNQNYIRGSMLTGIGVLSFPPLNLMVRNLTDGLFSRTVTMILVVLLFLGALGFGRVFDEIMIDESDEQYDFW